MCIYTKKDHASIRGDGKWLFSLISFILQGALQRIWMFM